jgi:hypothetical protein
MKHSNMINNKNKNNKNNNNLLIQLGTPQFLLSLIMLTEYHKHSLKYLLGMDNFFTQPVVFGMTRRLNVGLVGTTRRQRGLPPAEYKGIVNWHYNTLYKLPCEKDNQQ